MCGSITGPMALAMLPTQAKASSEGLPLRGAIYGYEQHQMLGYYLEQKVYEAPTLRMQSSDHMNASIQLCGQ